jgi:hypothetical protein
VYLALALAYGMPGKTSSAHSVIRSHLPDLRTLKVYGFNVRKFTSAQRYISRTVARSVL